MARHSSILIVGGLLTGFVVSSEPAEARRSGAGSGQFRAMPSMRTMPAVRTAMMRSVRFTTPNMRALPKQSSGGFAGANTTPVQRIPLRPPLSKAAFVMPAQGPGVWTNPNGTRPTGIPQPNSPQQKNVVPVAPPNALPPITSASLGMRPVDRQMTGLRDKLGLVPIETATGPGAAPQPSGATNTPGTPVQPSGGAAANSPGTATKSPNNGCVGAAGNLPNPGSIASTGGRYYPGQQIPGREVRRLERATSGEDVLNLRDDSFQYDGLTGAWRGRTNDGRPVTITFGPGDRVTIFTSGGRSTAASRYERRPDGRGMQWVDTTIRTSSGKEEVQTPATEDARIDFADGTGRTNTIAPTNPSDSQPAEGAPDNRDYWCETGVTNPDGPNGSRRDEPQQPATSQFGQPGQRGGSGVQIKRDPPPTPADLFARVSQPGVSGDVERPSGGGTRPPVASLAQPKRGNGPGGTVGAGAGVTIGPALKPTTPRPVDPE